MRIFTEEQIRKFKEDPNVRDVDKSSLRFKYSFRVVLYEAWEKNGLQGVKQTLIENGYDLKELGKFYHNLCTSFKRYGRPSNAKNDGPVGTRSNPIDHKNDKYLLSTGKFVKSRNGKGIAFSEEFQNELFSAWPEQSIEEGIRKAGIDPKIVGVGRINSLRRMFNEETPSPKSTCYSDSVIEKYREHPYIQFISAKLLRFHEYFFNEASFLIELMKVDEILTLYEIDPNDIPVSVRMNLKYKLTHWKRTDDQRFDVSRQLVRIQYRRYQKLTELLEERFRRIREVELPAMNHIQKKKLYYWVQGYPLDPLKIVNTSYLLKKIGISRSSYYAILRNDRYGVREFDRQLKDNRDIEIIRQVMDYRGYRKGIRQIYMMMEDITGYHFSMKKIKRLMKKFGLRSGLREKKQSRIDARKNLEEHKKPNLLKRKFRMARPNTHILTDVTYTPYGDNKLAYGSACYDAVTGRLYDLTFSDSNNLELVLSTVDALKNIVFNANAIFHSDQGSLYLTDTFQKRIEELNLRQSMSKRGNCWDNSPEESFFGHMKDEWDFRSCQSLLELQTRGRDYFEYYNTERRQWDRNQMTPLQYEAYLNALSEEEFEQYLEKEEEKYEAMKKAAEERAVQRAKALGV